ncbi:MAG: hypothetical protein KatS3mg031_2967 [Chitinophagales bacterium]|nr:MAG: hypothetical protein KatS3mg031_2967 [Chitinophagales bacterium]
MKVRCSQLHRIMTNSRSKDALSETAKAFVEEYYISENFGRHKELVNKYITKGLQVEEDSITLYSKTTKKFFVKNETTLENDYITGTPDLFIKKENEIVEVIDIKSSWDIWTYFRGIRQLNPAYYWQVMGYMWLTGAKKASVVYCLVDTPEILINDEKRKLMWKIGAISDEDEIYKKAAAELEKNMRFEDIPESFRITIWPVEYDEQEVAAIKERVEKCRSYYAEITR